MRSRFDLGVTPADLDVRVMVRCLRNLAYLVDKSKRLGKIREFELLFEFVVVEFPAVQTLKGPCNLVFRQFSPFHNRLALTFALEYNLGFSMIIRQFLCIEMRGITIFLFIGVSLLGVACGGNSQPASPVETMKTYTKAVKAKDAGTMKLLLSADTLKMLEQEAKSQSVPLDEIVKRETLFPESQKVFEFRNEKIEGSKATLEVKNSYGQWETWPFVMEDSQWKIDKKGYADRLMQDIEQQNDAAIDEIMKQNQIPTAPSPQIP